MLSELLHAYQYFLTSKERDLARQRAQSAEELSRYQQERIKQLEDHVEKLSLALTAVVELIDDRQEVTDESIQSRMAKLKQLE